MCRLRGKIRVRSGVATVAPLLDRLPLLASSLDSAAQAEQ